VSPEFLLPGTGAPDECDHSPRTVDDRLQVGLLEVLVGQGYDFRACDLQYIRAASEQLQAGRRLSRIQSKVIHTISPRGAF
jgi:hypothetical protein